MLTEYDELISNDTHNAVWNAIRGYNSNSITSNIPLDALNYFKELELSFSHSEKNVCDKMTLKDLIKTVIYNNSGELITSNQAKKLLNRYGVLITREYNVFIARTNLLLSQRLKMLDGYINLDHYLSNLPGARIAKNPRKISDGHRSVRGYLLDLKHFL